MRGGFARGVCFPGWRPGEGDFSGEDGVDSGCGSFGGFGMWSFDRLRMRPFDRLRTWALRRVRDGLFGIGGLRRFGCGAFSGVGGFFVAG